MTTQQFFNLMPYYGENSEPELKSKEIEPTEKVEQQIYYFSKSPFRNTQMKYSKKDYFKRRSSRRGELDRNQRLQSTTLGIQNTPEKKLL